MSFQKLPFLDVFKDATGGHIKTPQTEFLEEGEFPVVDQGQVLVAGFVNDRSRVCSIKPPVIVFGDHTRVIQYVDFEFAMGADGTKVLVPKIESDTKYLYYALKAIKIPAAGYSRHYKFLKETQIPLPPLPEQRRIADTLDKADALRAKRRQALAQLDTLTQSIFLDMFGDPATNPKEWPINRIDEITECLDRLRRPVTEADRKPGSVPYYGANGQQGWIDAPLFDEPLVLVAEDGGYFDAPERGVAYRIDGPAWVNNHAHILRAIPEHVDTEFLHRSLRHYNFRPYISGTTRAKLTQGQLNLVKLFVPPPELQQEFSKRIGHRSAHRPLHVCIERSAGCSFRIPPRSVPSEGSCSRARQVHRRVGGDVGGDLAVANRAAPRRGR